MTELLERTEALEAPHQGARFGRRPRGRLWIALFLTAVAALVVARFALNDRPEGIYGVLPAVGEYASNASLTGLSPASLHPIDDAGPYRDLDQIGLWATRHGYAGLSPASMAPADNTIRALLNPDYARTMSQIADYAQEAGLTGLSPASLGPRTTALTGPYADLADIADWARAHGMTGLSPASLSPEDE